MTWKREKRAIFEMRPFDGEPVPHVIGWVAKRHCGCHFLIGMRLDNDEFTFGAGSCAEHGAQVKRAYETLGSMPPQEREAGELFEELLEHELTASGVRT